MLPMTSAPLPRFYRFVTPLIRRLHRHLAYDAPETPDYSFAARAETIDLTIDEFPSAIVHYPIVFGGGDALRPMILTGQPGRQVNQFVDAETGVWREGAYIPAYVRRYPFLLARLDPEVDEMSLCFDGACPWLRDRDEGNLFADDDSPSETTQQIMEFCQRYEAAVRRTRNFMDELLELDLLVDLVRVDPTGKTLSIPGFQMIDEERLHQLRAEPLRKLMASGAQAAIFAHLFSLSHLGQQRPFVTPSAMADVA